MRLQSLIVILIGRLELEVTTLHERLAQLELHCEKIDAQRRALENDHGDVAQERDSLNNRLLQLQTDLDASIKERS